MPVSLAATATVALVYVRGVAKTPSCHDLTTAQQKHSRLTLNKLPIAFTASINTESVSIQCLIKNLPKKQCPLETETKESNNEWHRSRSRRMMTFWLLSSHIQQQQQDYLSTIC